MGQQQILLLVFCVIVVGLAIVFAIGAFSNEATSLVYDEYNEQALEVLERAVVLSREPTELGGGEGSFDNSWFNFDHIPCPFEKWDTSNDICHTKGEPANYSRMTVNGYGDHGEMEFYVVSKVNPADDHRVVPGSHGFIIRYRVDRNGVTVMNPKERREY